MNYEAEYNNRQRVPLHAEHGARWQKASQAYRAEAAARSRLDVAYGQHPREQYDLFLSENANPQAPLVVYIHGGYWQRGDRKDLSFLAKSFNAAGIDYALPSYPLCPEVKITGIIDSIRRCLVAIWKHTGKKPVVIGHSAGGHLTAAMLATDWSTVPGGAPPDLTTRGVAISGVFDLPPLVGTSINDAVGMTEESARAASPLFWPLPAKDRVLVAAVGGAESSEFLRQSRDIATAWSKAGLAAEDLVVPGADHFTVLDALADPGSTLAAKVRALAQA